MICIPQTFRLAAASLAMLASAACADRNPAAAPPAQSPGPAPLGALRCTVDVRAGTLACRAAQPDAAPGVRGAVLGGQGLNVRLASSGTSYDAATEILRSDVTVENLTTQMLGTADGHLPDPAGVRVFFAAGPDVTSGSGSVSVENADGIDAFTASGQPYFRYAGILAPGDTTAPKEWRFAVQPTVSTFSFTVYVAAPVAHEGGWVSLTPLAPAMKPGATLRMSAVVRNVAGRVVPGAKVAWSVTGTDPDATIDSTGLLTARQDGGILVVAAATTFDTATVTVFVMSTPYLPPTIASVQVDPALVDDDGLDSVTVRVAASDPNGVTSVSMSLVPPGGPSVAQNCTTTTPVTGTPTAGVFACRFGFAPGSSGGVWRVGEVRATSPYTSRFLQDYDQRFAGASTSVYVRGPVSDYIAPTLLDFTFSPDSVRTVLDTVSIDVTVADADTGVASVRTDFSAGGAPPTIGCVTTQRISGTIHNGVFRCRMAVPGFVSNTQLTVLSVQVRDRNNNVTERSGYDLEFAGYPVLLRLQPDTITPVITAFSFSPSTVKADGVDSVVVSLSATDTAWTGVRLLEAGFRQVGSMLERNCINAFVPATSRTVRCALRFNSLEPGQWRLLYLRATDNAGATRTMDATAAQAAGWPVDLTVTPP
ncbi:MAG TPA: hypothetical protein VF092_11155 [Longimicrobium sp.]